MRAWLCQLLSVKKSWNVHPTLDVVSKNSQQVCVSTAVNINMYAAYIEIAYLCGILNHNCILGYLRLAIGC
jgi:hypothetical protein